MPTYEYECRSCSHSFEAFQAMSEDPLTSCPECGGPVRRLIGGGTGIIFKGSGFYVNDSRKSSSASVPASTPKAGGDSASATGGETGSPKPAEGGSTTAPAPPTKDTAAPARGSPTSSTAKAV
jgi:putative FmdB family regulatory protein